MKFIEVTRADGCKMLIHKDNISTVIMTHTGDVELFTGEDKTSWCIKDSYYDIKQKLLKGE